MHANMVYGDFWRSIRIPVKLNKLIQLDFSHSPKVSKFWWDDPSPIVDLTKVECRAFADA